MTALAAVLTWISLIVPAAQANDVPVTIAAAVIYVESRGQPNVYSVDPATGGVPSVGLMGVRPYGAQTAAELIRTDVEAAYAGMGMGGVGRRRGGGGDRRIGRVGDVPGGTDRRRRAR